MNIDDIAKLAQKYTARQTAVIIGCGASIPYGLPSMSELGKYLIQNISSSQPTWKVFEQELVNTNNLELALQNVALPEDLLHKVVDAVWIMTAKKDLEVYDSLVGGQSVLALTYLFKYLLRTASPVLNVVTTNYDRLIEYAADASNADVFTGFSKGWLQKYIARFNSTQSMRPDSGYEGRVNLLKVHGSLDWFANDLGLPVGLPLRTSIPADYRPLIVTPGVSKYKQTHDEPFRTVITNADRVLEKASSYLCIGYGFNDEHIQPKLVSRVKNDDIPVVVVTRILTPATKGAFLRSPPAKYLLIEQSKHGSQIYCDKSPNRVEVSGEDIWSLGEFNKLLM